MAKTPFKPHGLPLLIGSLPMRDYEEATRMMLRYTPEIPLWVQLPAYPSEGMVAQFVPGMPGVCTEAGRVFIDTNSESFDEALVEFYEAYLALEADGEALTTSRFALTPATAAGFFSLLTVLPQAAGPLAAVKGQITGPFTFGTSLQDRNGRAVFYDDRLRDAAVKLIAMKARWQVRQLSAFGRPVILFLDEPALAGFGSSAFISISREAVADCFAEVIAAVHAEGGLAGIHVCANAEWSLILDSAADVVSFDAYAYFDKFLLYADGIRRFVGDGRLLALGIVPTLEPEDIERETVDSLWLKWQAQMEALVSLGLDETALKAQSLVTPSCGTGSLSLEHATRVLELTRDLAGRVRSAC